MSAGSMDVLSPERRARFEEGCSCTECHRLRHTKCPIMKPNPGRESVSNYLPAFPPVSPLERNAKQLGTVSFIHDHRIPTENTA